MAGVICGILNRSWQAGRKDVERRDVVSNVTIPPQTIIL
jgi:hypothetical protein